VAKDSIFSSSSVREEKILLVNQGLYLFKGMEGRVVSNEQGVPSQVGETTLAYRMGIASTEFLRSVTHLISFCTKGKTRQSTWLELGGEYASSPLSGGENVSDGTSRRFLGERGPSARGGEGRKCSTALVRQNTGLAGGYKRDIVDENCTSNRLFSRKEGGLVKS